MKRGGKNNGAMRVSVLAKAALWVILTTGTLAVAQGKHEMTVYVKGAGAAGGVLSTVLGKPIESAFTSSGKFATNRSKDFTGEIAKYGKKPSDADIANAAKQAGVRFVCVIDAAGIKLKLPANLSGSASISVFDAGAGRTVGTPQQVAVPPTDIVNIAKSLVALAVTAAADVALSGPPPAAAPPVAADPPQPAPRGAADVMADGRRHFAEPPQAQPAPVAIAPPQPVAPPPVAVAPPPPPPPPREEKVGQIAVYVSVGKDENVDKVLVLRMLDELERVSRFNAVDRPDAFDIGVKKVLEERPGTVIDEQLISGVGKEMDVPYVCVISLTPVFGVYQVSARVINTKTARVIAMGLVDSPIETMEHLKNVSTGIVASLMGPRRK